MTWIVSGLMPVASGCRHRMPRRQSRTPRIEHGLGHLRPGAVMGAHEQDAAFIHASRVATSTSNGRSRRAPPEPVRQVGIAAASLSPAATGQHLRAARRRAARQVFRPVGRLERRRVRRRLRFPDLPVRRPSTRCPLDACCRPSLAASGAVAITRSRASRAVSRPSASTAAASSSVASSAAAARTSAARCLAQATFAAMLSASGPDAVRRRGRCTDPDGRGSSDSETQQQFDDLFEHPLPRVP